MIIELNTADFKNDINIIHKNCSYSTDGVKF